MSSSEATFSSSVPSRAGFRHEALLYAGEDEFVSATADFIREGVAADDAMLVVVDPPKIDRLRDELGAVAEAVDFADMRVVGANPARIIPAWHEFADRNTGRALRGIGEPVNPERDPAALTEAINHEALLNVAFADTPDFWLLCPYDTQVLPPDVVAAAHSTHPQVAHQGRSGRSTGYRGVDGVLEGLLPEPSGPVAECTVGPGALRSARGFVAQHARLAKVDPIRADELVLSVNEVATNSLLYGGGQATLRVWPDGDMFVAEVRDQGHLREPLVGRKLPGLSTGGGRGLWMVNQLCDLVQLRSSADGTTVRLHMRR